MRPLLVIAGLATCALGFAGGSKLGDATLLQGALTLGGGWLICAAFSLHSKWHGYVGAGILALLAAARCAPALPGLLGGKDPGAPYQAAAFAIATVVLVATVRALLRERARRERERMMAGE
jgi:hypothetical protein